jgi:hypothetical protein
MAKSTLCHGQLFEAQWIVKRDHRLLCIAGRCCWLVVTLDGHNARRTQRTPNTTVYLPEMIAILAV